MRRTNREERSKENNTEREEKQAAEREEKKEKKDCEGTEIITRTDRRDSNRSSSARIPRNIRTTSKRSRQKLDSKKRKGMQKYSKGSKTHAKIDVDT